MQPLTKANDVALLIDWENIKWSLQDEEMKPNITAIREMAERYGRLVIARAYANWSDRWVRRDPGRLHDAGIEPVYVPTKTSLRHGGYKRMQNSVDVKLTADCLDIVHRYPQIQTVVLVSGDADFIHATDLIRPLGKRVVAIGVSWSSANRLVDGVDEFIEYDKEIKHQESKRPHLSGKDKEELERALKLVPKIVAGSRHPGRATSKWVQRELLKKMSGFDERRLGFDHFRLFLQQAEKRELIKLVTSEDMAEWVHIPQPPAADPKKPPVSDPLPAIIRFAHEKEQQHDFVAFNFLINRMMEARIVPLTRTQLAGVVSDAVDDQVFARGLYQRATPQGETKDIRTIELNHEHPAVQAALSDDEQLSTQLRALIEKPDSPEQHQQIAQRYTELEQWAQALMHQEKAIKLAPDRPALRAERIVLLGQAGRPKQAIESGRALTEAHPQSPHPLGALAQVYENSGRYRTAVPYYRQALALIPQDAIQPRLQFTLPIIRCYQKLDLRDKASALCRETRQWAGDAPDLQELCRNRKT